MSDLLFIKILREIILWSTPVIIFVGVFLILYGNYSSFQSTLEKELGLRKRIIPKLEKNVYAFHEWCLKKNILIGIICIIYSVIVFLVLRKLSFLNNLKG
jgi:hypothetical protein